MTTPRLLLVGLVALAPACSESDSAEAKPEATPEAKPDAKPDAKPAAVVGDGGEPSTAPRCKVEELTRVVQAAKDKPLREQRSVAQSALPKICQLPTPVQSFLELRNRKSGIDPGVPPEVLTVDGIRDVHDAICPEGGGVFIEAAPKPRAERANLIYDRCKLERFNLLSREAFALADVPSLIPFYLQSWLLEQGVPRDTAARLAGGMALLSVRDWCDPPTELPGRGRTLDLEPVPEGIGVFVTKAAVESPTESFATLDEGTVIAADREGDVLPKLKVHLEREAKRAASGSTPAPVRALLSIDAELPVATVLDVVRTASAAGIDDVQLIAELSPLEFGVLPLASPKVDPDEPPPLLVTQTEEGFEVHYDGKALRPLGAGGAERWDYDALRDFAGQFKRLYPETERVVVSVAAKDATHDDLFATLLELRQSFPKLTLSGGQTGGTLAALTPTGDAPDGPLTIKLGTGGVIRDDADDDDADDDGSSAKIRPGKVMLKGSLSKDHVTGVVKDNLAVLRACYDKGLATDPKLAGRVAIQFAIGPTGKVPVAVVAQSSVKDKNVGNCMAKAMKRLKFDQPTSGGSVVVTYPFKLSPG